MNTANDYTRSGPRDTIKTVCLISMAALIFGIYPGQPWAASQAEYHEDALFNPSTGILRAENRGRISIYDGLEHAVVDRAMDTQFDRIGNMMFIRTRQTLPDGSVESDDDCD